MFATQMIKLNITNWCFGTATMEVIKRLWGFV